MKKDFWEEYRKMQEDEYPPCLYGEATRQMLMRTHGVFLSFPNNDNMLTYFYFNKEDRPIFSAPASQYNDYIHDAVECLKDGDYYGGLECSLLAAKLNPAGALAYFYNATALWGLGKFEEAKKVLDETFKYFIEGSELFMYYKQYSFIESDLGNPMLSAACIAAAAPFKNYYFYEPKQNDPEIMLRDLTRTYGVNTEIAKAHTKEILAQGNVPYITPEGLTRRRLEYGIIKGYAADLYTAVIDGRTGETITDKQKLAYYDNVSVEGFEFANMDEALAYRATDGHGKHIGIMPQDNYFKILAEAKELEAKGEYNQAYERFFDAATFARFALEARVGGAVCQLGNKNYTGALQRLSRMFNYIVTDYYAKKFYELYADAEIGLENYLNAAACAYMALKFGDTEVGGKISIFLGNEVLT